MKSPQEIFDAAVNLHEAGQPEQAAKLYRELLSQDPAHADALQLLGVVEHQAGRRQSAIELISQAIQLAPQVAHFHVNLGEVLRTAGEFTRAEAALRNAIRLEPRNAPAHYNLALVLLEIGRPADAIAGLRQAIALDPAYVDAHITLATELGRSTDYAGAYAVAIQALRIQSNDPRALTIAGTAAAKGGKLCHGIELLRAALTIDPASATACMNLAAALDDLGSHADAIRAYREAIRMAPDDPRPASMILMTLLRGDAFDANAIADEHRNWGKRFAATVENATAPITTRTGKLRIGYVSGDFNAHAVATFLIPLLAAHDRQLLDVTCYATSHKHDAVTDRCRSLCDRWRNISAMSDPQAADQIRGDVIDILVDLSGHSEHHRLQLFARRPAPVQVTYLGYAATTGVDAIDYRITDDICDPPGMTEHLHTERLLRIGAPFLCYDPPPHAPPVALLPLDANGYVTFVSASTTAKITASAVAAWARILRTVPRSRLLMKHLTFAEEQTRAVWRDRFAGHGISAERIVFSPHLAHADHLATITQCDIALDTFPYCGTTTTCEALWMGVPVVSLVGQTHAARVGLTLLSSARLTDLATPTVDDYVAAAIALANDATRLRDIRAHLRATMSASPLTDGQRLARSIEAAYQSIALR